MVVYSFLQKHRQLNLPELLKKKSYNWALSSSKQRVQSSFDMVFKIPCKRSIRDFSLPRNTAVLRRGDRPPGYTLLSIIALD